MSRTPNTAKRRPERGGYRAAMELEGRPTAHSDGAGKGATLTLELPIQGKEATL